MRAYRSFAFLLTLVGLGLWPGAAAFGQLLTLEVERLPEEDCRPRVVIDHPEQAVVVIQSSITDLIIDSVLGILARYTAPDAQEYRLVVYPRNQILTIRATGYRPAELPLRDLDPRDTQCFSVERAHSRELRQIEDLVTSGSFEEAATRLQAYLLHTTLGEDQKRRALYWRAFALAFLDRPVQTTEAVRRMLEAGLPSGLTYDNLQDPLRQAVWTYFRLPPDTPPDLEATYGAGRVHIDWSTATAPDLAGYRLYRGPDPATTDRLVQIDTPGLTAHVDTAVRPDTVYYYRIAALDTLGIESPLSPAVRIETRRPLQERLTVARPTGPVRDVRTTVTDNLLVIEYALDGKASHRYRVQLALSNNAGTSYGLVPSSVSGDVGAGVAAGEARRIEWAIYEDFPNGLDDPAYLLRIDARRHRTLRTPLLLTVGGAVLAGGTYAILTALGGAGDPLGKPPERPPADP